jgi:phage/conjugal plasmid C-4 type zinc finger TraR family protein
MVSHNAARTQGLTVEQASHFEQRLQEEAERLQTLAVSLKTDGVGGELATPDDEVATPEDVAEAATTMDQYTALFAHVESTMRDIETAQGRIAAGSYGRCLDCGDTIPLARLEALPTAHRCITCQERWQQTRHGR